RRSGTGGTSRLTATPGAPGRANAQLYAFQWSCGDLPVPARQARHSVHVMSNLSNMTAKTFSHSIKRGHLGPSGSLANQFGRAHLSTVTPPEDESLLHDRPGLPPPRR